jgi:hypothetical protein
VQLLHASGTNDAIHEYRKFVTRPRSAVSQLPSRTTFARNGHLKALCSRTTTRQVVEPKKSLVSVCFVNVRGSGSKLIEVPSSHFYDLLASFGDVSGDGAADRRVRSKSEAAVGISGRGFD